ncbi:3-hydroxyisobutyrate dehydrogenase [Vreelandella songnenensis]|uniref:3-hydroxyisobutyrate dehydrogenase n=1 Tax=Vreelandella songnenensis TaxID=1176243 RepID=A0A2T0V6L7_9GAMM|nr:3-hydroxyisobutyrate dehydrogenase [Halomonas songnenensis]PRY65829.1 3-hydroxyisobutyrate dehydrogenase [Halomonas songnenensis]
MTTIAFIGLGNMGGPMAANLSRAGFNVRAFDLSRDALDAARSHGCEVAASAVDAAKDADVIISMLPAGQHVRGLFVDGETPLFEVIKKGALVIDSSTIDADTARSVAAVGAEKGIGFIDAPVSGGVGGAQAGTLTFIVGASAEQYEQARPLLEVMGKNIFHAGDHGAGQVAKACNNMLLAILMAGTCEAINMGVKNGLDPAVLSDIMKQSSGGNWALNVYNPYPGVMENAPASKGYQGGFLTDLMIKDLGLAMDISQQSAAPVPMGSAARALFTLHKAEGHGRLDFSSLMTFYQGKKGQ